MKELIERLREAGRPFTDDLHSEAADALERLPADRDSWRQQCSDRVADAVRFAEERDAWEKNCNDQIDLLNFTANERDAAESACQILALEVGELQNERDALRADAERLGYLCGDWAGETAAKRNRLLSRMSTMSISAVRAQIDADLAAIAGEKT